MTTVERRSVLATAALGACVGLAIGGSYLAGGLARASLADALAHQVAGAPALRGPLNAPGASELALDADAPRAQRPAVGVAPFILRAAAQPARDLECLSQAVYYEARGEEARGRQAVAQVVLNRVRHPRFPKSICGVVFQHAASGCAFTFACDGATRRPLEIAAWRDARRVAEAALSGFVLHDVGAATDFRGGAGPGAPSGLLRVAQIGGHVFYRLAGRLGEAAALTGRPTASAAESAQPVLTLASMTLDAAPAPTPAPAPPSHAEKPVGPAKTDASAAKPEAPAATPAA